MVATSIDSLSVDAKHPQVVFAAANGRVFRSTDGAQSWSETGPAGETLSTVVVSPGNGQRVFAAGLDGVFVSSNRGSTWRPSGLRDALVTLLAVSPRNARVVYAGTFLDVFRSDDGGRTWRQSGLHGNWVQSLVLSSRNPRIAVAAVFAKSAKLFGTVDGGRSWKPVQVPFRRDYVTGLAADPRNPTVVYMTAVGGIYKGSFTGGRWQKLGGDLIGTDSLLVDPRRPGVLYAGGLLDGVSRSTNGGRTWKAFNRGLSKNNSVVSLAADATGRVLYAGTYGGGVFDYRFR